MVNTGYKLYIDLKIDTTKGFTFEDVRNIITILDQNKYYTMNFASIVPADIIVLNLQYMYESGVPYGVYSTTKNARYIETLVNKYCDENNISKDSILSIGNDRIRINIKGCKNDN